MSHYILEIFLIAIFIYEAYRCVVNKTPINANRADMYTVESQAKFAKLYVVGAVIAIVYEVFLLLVEANVINVGFNVQGTGWIAYLFRIAGIIPIAVFTIIGYACVLKKTGSGTSTYNRRNNKDEEDF